MLGNFFEVGIGLEFVAVVVVVVVVVVFIVQ
jgi:hypothetical protein